MPAFIGYLGHFSWGGHLPGEFRPNGKVQYLGERSKLYDVNPISKSRRVPVGARIIVGFNVGTKPKWKMKDLIDFVREVRSRQSGIPDSSFIAQVGMYTHHAPGKRGTVVTEHGGQVLIKNLAYFKTSTAEFRDQMEELATELVRHFKQELVIVDWQERGMSVEKWLVTP